MLLFQASSILLILGIARNSACIMAPWIFFKWLIIIMLIGMILAEITLNTASSQYMAIICIILAFGLLNWISVLVTYWQIRKQTKKVHLINNLNYINLTSLD